MLTSNGAPPSGGQGVKRKYYDYDDNEPIDLSYVPPYEPKTEAAPKSVALSDHLQRFEDCKTAIHQLLLDPFRQSGHNDEHTQSLISLIHKDFADEKSEKIIVCVSGNMNTGKSSTINSLFQCGMIASEGDDGGSCTLATHVYQKMRPNQQAPFVAEVVLFSRDERREIFAGYLAAYYRAYHTKDDEDGQNGNNEDDKADLTARNDIADALHALFVDHPACETARDVASFLEEATCEDDPEILSRINDWADMLVLRATQGRSSIIVESSTAGLLTKKLEKYCTYVEDDDGNRAVSYWPLASVINYHFDDPVTNLGILLVDTPGLSDNNRTRRISAIKHRNARTHALIVTDAARARDDSTVAKEVRVMRSRGPGRVVIVSPKADAIGDTTMPHGSKVQKDDVAKLKDRAAKLSNELNSINAQLGKVTPEQNMRLVDRMKEVTVRRRYVLNAEKSLRITMRSDYNRKMLQEKLVDKSASAIPPPVVSVGNKDYAQHLQGFWPQDAPALSVTETNIPELRSIFFAFPNEARLNEAKHLHAVVLPSLLNRVNLYAERRVTDLKADMEFYVKKPIARYGNIIEVFFGILESAFKEKILLPIKDYEADFLEKATHQCIKWASGPKLGGFRTQEFLQLMNRNGLKKGRSGPDSIVNLSATLISFEANNVSRLIQKAVNAVGDFQKGLEDELMSLYREMVNEMQEATMAPLLELKPFFIFLETESGKIPYVVRQSQTRLLQGLSEVCRDISEEDELNYLSIAMRKVYAKVRVLKGGKDGTKEMRKPKHGWPAQRLITFKHEVTKINGVWADVHNAAKTAVDALLRKERARLADDIGAIFDDFLTGFNLHCEAADCTDESSKRLREMLKVNLGKAEEILSRPMRQAVASLVSDFK